MNTLLILDSNAARYKALVEQQCLGDLDIITACDRSAAAALAPTADIILGRPDLVAAILLRATRLRWVQSTFAGNDALLAPGLRTDYLLTGIKNVHGPLLSEYVMAYILARERQLFTIFQQQLDHQWHPVTYRGLNGLIIGVVGLGSIGRHIAKTAQSFGMHVLGMKRNRDEVDHVERVFLPAERAEFLPLLDYLVLVLPATPATRNFIGTTELSMMKHDSVLINVGRGSAVHPDDLCAALHSGTIGGAILDVFEQEPLPKDSPLWDAPRTIITPHIAAFSFPNRIAAIFCDNYRRYQNGLPLEHRIDFARGY
ncbi:D-2-hydroxyacid dehydrogenase [Desulfofustis glycolicus]|uniref:Phosphoglycerate dehydrogenase n=1 Tax=Desulfofustis glycolicus DSM 9705 TaxID=1121409 RepID=A0A1M5V4U1_9BACT|nr:D-2-hydroxyacid dehydrogenase [Desulfofustis glycolicus]MCB2214995.1 D-2-hydroxyacid dehydrogenase [Desulfobulbaceae bacterium]SHH70235.1 Phosphoglycerate dehydrogenase [Desulfofustis glycolicus DSM 9705]